jgi:hypothetical protein
MRVPRFVPGTNYCVSDEGIVFGKRGTPLKPYVGDRAGHLRVDLGGRRAYVHQLVAEAFIGPRPAGQEVRHLNGDPSDNRVENLAYGTRSQNVLDSVQHGTYRNNNREKGQCPQGHDYDTVNTYVDPRGRRRCRACRRDRWS